MVPYFLYRFFIRPLLFYAEAERAHNLVLATGKKLSHGALLKIFGQKTEYRPTEVMGLKFNNPVGMAAGVDKNGEAIDFFGALGFGFLELGTVTPKPQEGNPLPRMFRVREAKGIINRMGFNNKGVDFLVHNLQQRTYKGVVGVSIGKNETTPLAHAFEDYLICMDKVYQYADYIAVNVSCPNTPDLTRLQQAETFAALLKPLKMEQGKLADTYNKYVPLVVKISPDLYDTELRSLCDVCLDLKIDGISCTNTTVSREIIHGMTHANEWGGLSGKPLYTQSTWILKKVSRMVHGAIPLIGIGGVSDAVSAREKLNSGASLVQLYTSLVYKGPEVIKEIVDHL